MLNLNTLNPQQRLAVETTAGPVLILAGAGTGKTRVITVRIAYLISKGVPPGKILAVTFTNKAAKEMRERVHQLVPRKRAVGDGPKPETPTICTFHSLGSRILRQYIDRLGYKKNFVIYSDSDQLAAIKKVLSHFHMKAENVKPDEMAAAISRIKNGLRKAFDSMHELAKMILPRYQSALRACNALDFDDLLGLTLQLFKEHPDVLQACREQYQYVMVDEYQDTNAAQFELVRLLTAEHQNLCVVGDDDQSIYGWRGAEIANLLDMEKHYPRVKVVKLEQNYRSTNTILEAANAVIVQNTRRRAKRLWSQKGQGSLIRFHTFTNEEEEAKSVVEQIEYARQIHRIPLVKQAILFRTNQQARALETALRAGKVKYHVVGGQSYFDRREIKDFLAYLRAFINPHDDVSLLRIANVPARGLSDLTMERLVTASQKRKCSVYSAMRHTDVQEELMTKTRDALLAFLALLDAGHHTLENTQDRAFSLRGWADGWLNQIGYWQELKRGEKTPEAAENRIRNLKDLVATLDHAKAGGDQAGERLGTFLEDITLDTERDEEDKEAQGDEVTLITMHSCKGLEFPHVYVVGLEEGLLPHTRSLDEGTVDEERRLFYVSITRAQESLSISHSLARKKYGELVACHPSRFLSEVPAHLTERPQERKVGVAEGKERFASLKAALRSQE